MLNKLAITIGFVLSLSGCLTEMDATGDLEQAAIVTSPDDTANVGGAENCPPDQADRPGGCTGEGGGGGPTGGSGSTGDTCTPGQPGCSGPVNCSAYGAGYRYDWLLHMCVHPQHGQSCTDNTPPWNRTCSYDTGGFCQCFSGGVGVAPEITE